MKKKLPLLILFSLLAFHFRVHAQGIGIGTTIPHPSAQLDITSASRGVLIPRMTTAGIQAIAGPAKGLLVYDSVKNQLMVNSGSPSAPDWQDVASITGWSITGNAATDPTASFIGTTDNKPLRFRINNQYAGGIDSAGGTTFFGYGAGSKNTGTGNQAFGFKSMFKNTVGSANTAMGDSSLYSNTSGGFNVAGGANALFSNIDGSYNTAVGAGSLYGNTHGSENSALGSQSLYSNSTGVDNTAVGASSMHLNTTGAGNTAAGYNSLGSNTAGNNNTAAGSESLFSNSTGNNNTAAGEQAMYNNTTGTENTAAGYRSLYSNVQGTQNTAIGNIALYNNINGGGNTANGYAALWGNTYGYFNTGAGVSALYANTTGNNNTGVGYQAMSSNTTGGNNTAIGSQAMVQGTAQSDNTACGYLSLYYITTGQWNTAIGERAMAGNTYGSYNTGIGVEALKLTTGSQYNTAIGYRAGNRYDLGYNNVIIGADCDGQFDGQYNIIAIGQGTSCSDNSQARFGNSATVSIGGYAGWTNISDGRFKKDIQEDVKGLDFILKLRPVTYRLDVTALSRQLKENHGQEWNAKMKQAIADKEKMVFTGFIAQEVEQAAKQAHYEFSGVDKPQNGNGLYGLRYSEFVVPLTKAIQEQQQLIEKLQAENAALLKENMDQQQRYKALLERVNTL